MKASEPHVGTSNNPIRIVADGITETVTEREYRVTTMRLDISVSDQEGFDILSHAKKLGWSIAVNGVHGWHLEKGDVSLEMNGDHANLCVGQDGFELKIEKLVKRDEYGQEQYSQNVSDVEQVVHYLDRAEAKLRILANCRLQAGSDA
ncbi:MAG: hypothetical protein AAF581_11110 [Planctomycetota bacterium]